MQSLLISIYGPPAYLGVVFVLYDLQTAVAYAPQEIAPLQSIHLHGQHPLPYPEGSLVFCKLALCHSLHRRRMNLMQIIIS